MRRQLFQQVRERFQFACGYCGVTEIQVGAELTLDHFQPRSAQGSDGLENLVYCCPACNSFKGAWWMPENDAHLLHPLRDSLTEHLEAGADGTLQGLTPAGRFHIERLQLNREPLIRHRQLERLRRESEQEKVELLQELTAARDELSSLLQQFGVDQAL